MTQAACKIQTFFRTFFAAYQYQLARSRLIKFQAVYRSFQEQARYKQALARVLNLQAVYRGYAQRKKYQLVRSLAIKLQAQYRRIRAKGAFKVTRDSDSKSEGEPGEASAADTRIQVEASFATSCNFSVIRQQTSPLPTRMLSPAFVPRSSGVRYSPASPYNVTPEATVPTCDQLRVLILSSGNPGPAKYVSLSFVLLFSPFAFRSRVCFLWLSFLRTCCNGRPPPKLGPRPRRAQPKVYERPKSTNGPAPAATKKKPPWRGDAGNHLPFLSPYVEIRTRVAAGHSDQIITF